MAYQKISHNDPCNKKINTSGLIENIKQKIVLFFQRDELPKNGNSNYSPIKMDRYNYKNLGELQEKARMMYRWI